MCLLAIPSRYYQAGVQSLITSQTFFESSILLTSGSFCDEFQTAIQRNEAGVIEIYEEFPKRRLHYL